MRLGLIDGDGDLRLLRVSGDFGAANPVHALGRAVARLAAYPAPPKPRTTFNVGRIEGGSGVNVIPREARMDVDLRSESPVELGRLDAFFRRAAREAADDENAARRPGTPPLELEVKLIGDRPSGETARENNLVRLAEEATRALGFAPLSRTVCARATSLSRQFADETILIRQGETLDIHDIRVRISDNTARFTSRADKRGQEASGRAYTHPHRVCRVTLATLALDLARLDHVVGVEELEELAPVAPSPGTA